MEWRNQTTTKTTKNVGCSKRSALDKFMSTNRSNIIWTICKIEINGQHCTVSNGFHCRCFFFSILRLLNYNKITFFLLKHTRTRDSEHKRWRESDKWQTTNEFTLRSWSERLFSIRFSLVLLAFTLVYSSMQFIHTFSHPFLFPSRRRCCRRHTHTHTPTNAKKKNDTIQPKLQASNLTNEKYKRNNINNIDNY